MEEESGVERAIAIVVGIHLRFIDRATCGGGTCLSAASRLQCLGARGTYCRARLRRDTIAHRRKRGGDENRKEEKGR